MRTLALINKSGVFFGCLISLFILCSSSLYAQDADNDGVLDTIDRDDDNDGILDTEECPLTNALFTLNPGGSNGNVSGTAELPSGTSGSWQITQTFFSGGSYTTGGVGTSGDLYFDYTGSSAWDLESTFSVSFMGNTNFQMALIGNQGEGDDFGSKFGNYTISWVGGMGDAMMMDPLDQTETADGALISNGGNFIQRNCSPTLPSNSCKNSVAIKNNFLEWQVIFPKGVSEFTINATGGASREGFRFSVFEPFVDADNNGVSDCFEVDSDGDGCYDAVEGTGNFKPSDLTSSGNLADDDEGFVDGEGIPLSGIGGVQLIQNLTPGVKDANDIDACDDGDGVDAMIEDAAPNGGDGNADGILDSEQPEVVSLLDASGNGTYVTLEVTSSECAEITSAFALEESAIQNDSGFIYPLGMIDFTAQCQSIGHTMDVKIYWHGVSNISFFRKYGDSFPGAGDTTYRNFSVERGQESIGGHLVGTTSYSITDGQSGDSSVLQRQIKDPAGPATADLDGDMEPDETDLDDDNDGILDSVECSGTATNWNISSSTASTNNITGNVTITDGTDVANLSIVSTNVNLLADASTNLISFEEQTNQIITVTSDIQLIDLEIFIQGLYATAIATTLVGNFQVEFWDGSVIANVPFETQIGDNGFPTDVNSTESPLSILTVSGNEYAYDNTDNGISNQAYGIISFPALSTSVFNTSGVKSISFSVLAGGPTDTNAFGFRAAIAKDVDDDGILNCFDTDSDDDGCPDAVEGKGGVVEYELPDLNINESINIALYPVDGFGVPNGGNVQGIGDSQDETILKECCNIYAPTLSAF